MPFDPLREAAELRNQLSSDKRRLAFFFGAGTSQAVGIPGLSCLTTKVAAELEMKHSAHYGRLLARDDHSTVETVLNRIRLCREILGVDTAGTVEGLTSAEAASLDRAICRSIRNCVAAKPPRGLRTHYLFAHWLKTIVRAFPLEIFTTNYDLLLEKAMESAETPYFDGFVGSVSPFFRPATIDADFGGVPLPSAPRDWIRLWKLHGSIGWILLTDELTASDRIVRRGDFAPDEKDELLVYPSRQKYSDSRRLPFLAYQDRFRRLLGSGETLLVCCGYSFADEHLNEIIFQSLRSNPRLAMTVLCHDQLASQSTQRNLLKPTDGITNLTIYGPDGAVVGGHRDTWIAPSRSQQGSAGSSPVWDDEKRTFRIGDFNYLVDFLRTLLRSQGTPLPPLEPAGAD